MEKLRFTYWLGAGASALAHPVVSDFRDRLESFEHNDLLFDFTKSDVVRKIIDEFDWLAAEIRYSSSPDTRAKVAFLSHDFKTYKRIKDILTIFFFIQEQSIIVKEKKVDPRYINFLASLLRDEPFFPDNVKILSWNYDYQVQLAGYRISGDLIRDYTPGANANRRFANLIQLNGCAYKNGETNLMSENLSIESLWERVRTSRENEFISFAWERKQPEEQLVEHLNQTDVLVVIGYSFPFFNRDTDKRIFDALKQGKLSRIYFQDKFRNGNQLYEQFDLPFSNSEKNFDLVKHIPETELFFIPNEY